jgi:hypothetical protein
VHCGSGAEMAEDRAQGPGMSFLSLQPKAVFSAAFQNFFEAQILRMSMLQKHRTTTCPVSGLSP